METQAQEKFVLSAFVDILQGFKMEPDQPAEVKGEEPKPVGFYERLVDLPVVNETLTQTTAIYNTVKNQNSLTQYACSTGENVVKRVADAAYTVGTPIADVALKAAKPLVGDPGIYTVFTYS